MVVEGYSLLKDHPIQWRGFDVEYHRVLINYKDRTPLTAMEIGLLLELDPKEYKQWLYKVERDIQWWPLEIGRPEKKPRPFWFDS